MHNFLEVLKEFQAYTICNYTLELKIENISHFMFFCRKWYENHVEKHKNYKGQTKEKTKTHTHTYILHMPYGGIRNVGLSIFVIKSNLADSQCTFLT